MVAMSPSVGCERYRSKMGFSFLNPADAFFAPTRRGAPRWRQGIDLTGRKPTK